MELRTIRKIGGEITICVFEVKGVESGCECDGRFKRVSLIKELIIKNAGSCDPAFLFLVITDVLINIRILV
jgi:hypothetical protein